MGARSSGRRRPGRRSHRSARVAQPSRRWAAGAARYSTKRRSVAGVIRFRKDYTTDEAHDMAHFIGLEAISTIKGNVGDLDRVRRIVKVVGFVNCPDDYGDHPEVLNGFSDLMEQVFGRERGVHARSAVGTNSLPRQMPVEIEMIVEVD